jgi:hypothetical protein
VDAETGKLVLSSGTTHHVFLTAAEAARRLREVRETVWMNAVTHAEVEAAARAIVAATGGPGWDELSPNYLSNVRDEARAALEAALKVRARVER